MFSVVALTRIYMLAYVSNTKQSPAIIALRIRRISEVFLFVCNKIKKTLYVNKIRNVRVISLTGVIAVFFSSFFGRIFFDNSSFSKLFESPPGPSYERGAHRPNYEDGGGKESRATLLRA